MQTLAIVNQKGGTGKTTTAVNLAAGLVRAGKWVLLVDLDPQSSAGYSLGVEPSGTGATLAHVILENRPLLQAIRTTHLEGLELVPGGPELATLELRLKNPLTAVRLLARLLEPVRAAYDCCVLDAPPALSLLFTNALAAADGLIVPVTPSFLSAKGLEALLGTIEEARADLQISPRLLGILLTMVDRRLALDKEMEAELRRVFGSQVFRQMVRLNVRLKEAPGHFKSIFEHAPDSAGAEDYTAFTAEVLERLGQAAPAEPAPAVTTATSSPAAPSVPPPLPATVAAGGS